MRISSLLEQFTQLDYDHFLEMNVEAIKNFNPVLEYDFMGELITFYYEMEYKWFYLSHNSFTGSPRRKENILAIFETQFREICKVMAEAFSAVFKKWLSSHALTNPHEWAESRYNEYEEMGQAQYEIFDIAVQEYDRYVRKGQQVNIDGFSPKIVKIINSLPAAKEYLEAISEESAAEQDKEYGGPIDNLWDIFENIDSFLESLSKWNFRLGEEFVIQFMEFVVFPLWYKKWKAAGIDETRRRNQEIYDNLQNIESLPHRPGESQLMEQSALINIAINATHQGGSMLEYFEEMYGIGSDAFDQFEENVPDKWKQELEEIGVDMSTN